MLAKLIIKEKSNYKEYNLDGMAVFIICPPEDVKRYTDEEIKEMAKNFGITEDFGSDSAKHLAIINHHISLRFKPVFATNQRLQFKDEHEITTEIYMEMPCASPEIKE